ncbi:hypothetical protein B566_EDAN006251 [Ephemera danica]|nr:hypothetical protein B566_EDAN006251 [Ephemera danica]
MSIFPVACSLMASFMSAITILGVSKEIYSFGTEYVIINISYGLFTPIAAYGFLPVFYKMQSLSVYEYLERRFGIATRVAASLAFSLQMILYMGIVLYAPALALSAVTGLSKLGALLAVGLVCTFYSAIGGMKAVLVTDMFQLMPLFVMDSMGHIPGLPGLFVAGIFSGSLSTVSSAVNSLAAVTIEDYLKPILAYNGITPLSDKKSTFITKLTSIFYGMLCIGIAFIAEHLGGVLQAALTIFGVVGGPLFGLFTLGMFFWIANETGAIAGLICGLAIAFWIGFGGPKPPLPYLPVSTEGCNATESPIFTSNSTFQFRDEEDHYFPLYRISYMYYVVIGFLVTLLVGLLVSVIRQKIRPLSLTSIDPDLYSPFIKRFVPVRHIKVSLRETSLNSSRYNHNMDISGVAHQERRLTEAKNSRESAKNGAPGRGMARSVAALQIIKAECIPRCDRNHGAE